MTDLLIQNALVLRTDCNTQLETIPAQDILVKGQRIEAVQPTGEADPSRFQTVIQANGKIAMPGLINTHAHVPMVLFRGLAEDVSIERWFNDYIWPLESNLQPEDVYWGMLLGLAEMIEAGVTSVAEHYFYMDEAARAVEQAGTRALLGWAMFGSDGQQQINETAAFIQRWQGAADGRITGILAPHSPYLCDDDFLRACARKAEQIGVGIHIHAAETWQQTEASVAKSGRTPVQVLADTGVLDVPTILAHVIAAQPQDIELLTRYPTGIAHAPKTYLKLAMGYAPVTDYYDAGIPVGLASDGAVSNNTLDLLEAMRLMAMTQKQRHDTPEVMPIAQAFDIATQGSARVYGLPDDLGAVAPGRLADLILIDMSGIHHQPLHNIGASLVYNTRAGDVQTVICNGKVLMRDRQLLTLNKAEIVQRVNQNMGRLAQRVPSARIQMYNP